MSKTSSTHTASDNIAVGISLSSADTEVCCTILRRQDTQTSLLDSRTFALAAGTDEILRFIRQQAGGHNPPIMLGLNSSLVRFLSLDLPPVNADSVRDLLTIQLESRLPIPPDQLEFVWQSEMKPMGLLCRAAALRKDHLTAAFNGFRQVHPDCAVEAEGIFTLLKGAFNVACESSVTIWEREHDYLLIFAENGCFMRSVVVDSEGDDKTRPLADFVFGDLRAELESGDSSKPILLISEPSYQSSNLQIRFEETGRTVHTLAFDEIRDGSGLEAIATPALASAGLAMLAFDAEQIQYNFAKANAGVRVATNTADRLRNAVLITIGLLVLCFGYSYWQALEDVSTMQKALSATFGELTAEEMLQRQAFRESVARARPDLADLIQKIQNCRKGVILDSLEFEKGKPVKIAAVGDSYEMVYAFQRELERQEGISQIRLLEPRMNERDRKVQFSMTFHYRHFSK